MFKFLKCLFHGHDWKILSDKVFPPITNQTIRTYNDHLLKRAMFGYREIISRCEYCGEIKEDTI